MANLTITRKGTTPSAPFAGVTAQEQAVPFAQLPILEAVTTTGAADSELIAAGITELLQRLAGGALDFEARTDIAADLLAASDRIHALALLVLA